jgi:hypothetical protein
MNDPQISVATLASKIEADVVRDRLEGAGVQAVVTDGSQTRNGDLVSSGFHVRVAESDFASAMAILFPIPNMAGFGASPNLPSSGDLEANWTCAGCGESVHSQADRCWSCGKPRDPASRANPVPWPSGMAGAVSFPADMPPMPGAPFGAPPGPAFPGPAFPRIGFPWPGIEADAAPAPGPAATPDRAAPERSSTTAEMPRVSIPSSQPKGTFAVAARRPPLAAGRALTLETLQGDRAAKRAWYTALAAVPLFFLLVGPVVNAYSMCVLLEAGYRGWRLSFRGNLMFFGALAINAAAFVAAGYAISRN